MHAEAHDLANESAGDQVIVKTVKRDGEIVSKEKEGEARFGERCTRGRDRERRRD